MALGLLGVSSTALADERTEARRFYQQGMDLVVQGQYEAGIQKLELAYETLPHPNVLYNIARAYVEMGEYERALDYFRQYLETEPADREEVREVVAKLQSTLDRQRATLAAAQPTEPGKPSEPGEPGTGEPGPGQPGKEPGASPSGPAGPGAQPSETGPGFTTAKTEDIYEQTVVTATRGQQSPLGAPNSTTIITSQDIRLSGITKIPELLRRAAGVDIMQINGSDTNVSIRGFNGRLSNKLLVLVDGRSVYLDVLGATLWETLSIDVDQIERIEVVRGPGSALYGADAFSGVVNIITKEPGEGRSGARVGFGSDMESYGSTRAVGREGDLGYRLSAGYTRNPRWSQSIDSERVDVYTYTDDQKTSSTNHRFNAELSQRFGKNTSLNLGGGFATGVMEVSGIGVFYDMMTRYENATTHAQLKTSNFRARVYFNRYAADVGMNANYIGQTNYSSRAVNSALDAEVELFDAHRLGTMDNEIHVGLNYRRKNIDWMIMGGETTEHHGAVFFEDSLKPADWMKIVLSGRLDYNPYLESLRASPRGSVIVHPSKLSAIRATAATAYRKAAFLEAIPNFPLQLPVTAAEGQYGNDEFLGEGEKVQPEEIFQIELGYLNQENEYFEWDVAAYWSRGKDFIDGAPFPVASPSDVAGGAAGYNPNTGRYTIAYGGLVNECATRYIYGGEVGVRAYPVVGLDVFANYALTLNDVDKPAGCFAKTFDYQSKHKVNAGLQVRSRLGISGELTYHYQSKQMWNEMVVTLGTTDVTYRDFPLDSLHLVNARLGYAFLKNKSAEVSVRAYNLLGDEHQQHPIGQLIGRRFMGFMSYNF